MLWTPTIQRSKPCRRFRRKGVTELLHVVADPSDKRVPEVARACLAALGNQLLSLEKQIGEFDRMIMTWHRSNQTSKRLHYTPKWRQGQARQHQQTG
jgi:hypothetical protein